MFRTRWIRKLLARNNSVGRRGRQLTKTRKPVRLRLEALEDRVVPDATTVVGGNCSLNFFGNHDSPEFIVPVVVNDNSGGTATSGTMTISLEQNNTITVLGSATVGSNGEADVTIDTGALPANLQPGNFTLVESFSGSGNFDASSDNATLTINVLETTITPITVTVTANTTTSTTTVTETPSVTLPNLGDAGNFSVLLENTCGDDTLHIANSTITGNVGVGGSGTVQLSGPVTIHGDIDFAGSGQVKDDDGGEKDDGKDDHGKGDDEHNKHEEDGDDVEGPAAVHTGDADVTAALNAVNALSHALAGLGTDVNINGGGTLNESDGMLVTINGVSYRVFNVKSFHAGDHDELTIKGDGSGNPVVFNCGGNGDVDLGGDIKLTGGLTPGQVVWNITGSGGKVHIHGDDDHHPDDDFEGTVIAPNDSIDLDHVHIVGHVFGGDCSDMQINGNSTITTPPPVPTTTTTTTTSTFTVTVTVTSPTMTVTSGSVTVEVIVGNQTIVLGSGNVGPNGTATITVTNPTTLQELDSLPPGTFEIIATFTGAPGFSGSTAPGTLTVTPSSIGPDLGATTPPVGGGPGSGAPSSPAPGLSPIQAALQLAVEAAMLGNLNNPGSVGELQAFSDVFLGHDIPTSIPQLISDILSLLPQAGPMLGPALAFTSFLDFDLPIENPM